METFRMSRPVRCRRHERGTLLLAVLLLVVLLGGLSVAALENGLADRTGIRHRESSLKALEIAEVGLARAEMEILALQDFGSDGIGSVSGEASGGRYEVRAVRSTLNPDRWDLVARGEFAQSVRRIAVGVRRRDSAFWVEGFFAREGLTFGGSIATDSYDSSKGTYASQAVNIDMGGKFARKKGHVGSNGGIEVGGTKAHIRGNAIAGVGEETTVSGQPNIGDILPRTEPIDLQPPPEEDFWAAYNSPSNGNMMVRVDDGDGINGDPAELVKPASWQKYGYSTSTFVLRPAGQTVIYLPGGTYFFTNVDLSGGATLEVGGPCKIYVTGDLDLTGGGLVNPTSVPANCQIFAHPYNIPTNFDSSGKGGVDYDITLKGGEQVAAAIYAPYRDATITGTGDLFGSLVAQNINVTGDAYFHYDEALANYGDVNEVFLERLYWHELGVLRR